MAVELMAGVPIPLGVQREVLMDKPMMQARALVHKAELPRCTNGPASTFPAVPGNAIEHMGVALLKPQVQDVHQIEILTAHNQRDLTFEMPHPLCFAAGWTLECNISEQSRSKIHLQP